MTPRVAVVGGGLAGITAALACADAGYRVTLYESRPRLGGLTYSFERGGLRVDNGQHVFLRCCERYRALLTRLGVERDVNLQERLDIPVRGLSPGTSTAETFTAAGRLRRLSLPAPLHLSWALLRYPWLDTAARVRFVRAALALRAVDPADPRSDTTSFGAWLREYGQDRAAIESLWDLVGIATLNARADDVSLALAATVFQIGLLTEAAAADIGWARVPLGQLHGEAAGRALAASGVDVVTHAKVTAVRQAPGGWALSADDTAVTADAVVLAVPPDAAAALLPPGAVDLGPDWAAALGSSPIINVHAVYDRKVMDGPFLAGIGTAAQWVFDRTAASGLDDGQYLAVSVSAADEFVDLPTAELRRRFLPALNALLPATRAAEVRDFFVTRERHATFRPSPGTTRLRPAARTALPGLYLAGAWTATGWPATMEGAVRSGESASAALLSDLSPIRSREAVR
ncbi:squalene-associated FAD-dependent desaturase [Nocardia transvalensis]|uniref:Squalene-associated FAD-dependent desaturase n=1 Tax=Nocardia transvalensis TaxID=37333 RepID=A0A7W9PAE5_9NOCA|nr:hydroxysqualene dehydroxylase HpnE [Nocardia transvalensis]MBB5912118.1 squalene-associated FAD-dependent desaturase [Nocardia transvalensis]